MQAQRSAQGEGRPTAAPVGVGRLACDDCDIVREADHRIANHLALLSGFVRLKASDLARRFSQPSGEEIQLLLGSISAQLVAVGRLHRSLTHLENATADLGDHLQHVTQSLSGLCENVEIIEDFADGCVVRTDQVLPLTQIVSEALLNAVKYGRPTGARPVIHARCFLDSGGCVQVEIADNGPGLPDGFDPARDGGLGFSLLRAFAMQLKASLAFESSKAGLCFRLSMPPPETGRGPR